MNFAMNQEQRMVVPGLVAVFLLAAGLRLAAINVGSPFITIDDKSAFEGGFLVWFGHAPPQRMYLESWLYGIVCIAVYVGKVIAGTSSGALDVDIVARAYRDFYGHPELYVTVYRAFNLVVDLMTALLVYRIALHALGERWRGWAAACVAAMYLLSYNTLWSGVVARPDSFLTFFCCLGLLLYLKSDGGRNQTLLLGGAAALGIAAGMKLHGAFLVIFICIDLLRLHGLRDGMRNALLLAVVSVLFFCVAAGSPLFDPLTYAKLRFENYVDDRSPWLHWGAQFWSMLRGTGWLTLALAIPGAWVILARRRSMPGEENLRSILLVGAGWLLLFALTRQLRPYWMLPALPVFYILAVYGATSLLRKRWGVVAAGLMIAVLAAQFAIQLRELRVARYNELRDWVVANAAGRPFYILGFDALILPKNTTCMTRTAQALERRIKHDLAAGLPFTLRHAKNWEESSSLALLDMLGFAYEPGYEFYDYYSTPPEMLSGIVALDRMNLLVVQERFDLDQVPEIRDKLTTEYRPIAERYGAGGGERGLKYLIYERR
jgi:hypothetical protein